MKNDSRFDYTSEEGVRFLLSGCSLMGEERNKFDER